MSYLLEPLTDLQQHLIEVIAEVFLRHRRWPIYDYVEKLLDRVPTDASLVMASLPNSQRLYGGGPYSAVWTTGGSNDRPVQLTVLGLHHSKQLHRDPRYPPLEDAFFITLSHLIAAYRTVEPSPFEVMTVAVEADEIADVLRQAKHEWLPLEVLFDLMKHEPATWYGNVTERSDGKKAWLVTRHVMDYEGIVGVADYVERMAELAPPPPQPPRPPLPEDALPEALDFLDAIWRLVPSHDESLLVLFSAERAARLGQPAATEDELANALSALGEVLTSLRVPKVNLARTPRQSGAVSETVLRRLQAHLHKLLPPDGHERVDEAVGTLQLVVDLRHGAHHGHGSPRSKAASAYERLRIGFPPPNPASAWETIRAETVTALAAIRDELAPLTRNTNRQA